MCMFCKPLFNIPLILTSGSLDFLHSLQACFQLSGSIWTLVMMSWVCAFTSIGFFPSSILCPSKKWSILQSSAWVQFSSVQLLTCVWLFEASWTAARQASLFITNSPSLLKLMSIESVMPSNYLIFCHPLFLQRSIFPSIRVFSNELALRIGWPKYWSFSYSISPSNEYSGLISFRTDWLDLLSAQGTLKSLLQHHSSKASILWCSAFFMVQL